MSGPSKAFTSSKNAERDAGADDYVLPGGDEWDGVAEEAPDFGADPRLRKPVAAVSKGATKAFVHPDRRRGRGAVTNTAGRYEAEARVAIDDGWGSADDEPPPLRTTIGIDTSRTIITRNQSPDVPFDRSINPYRGCEHGCIYCFARPTHAYLGLSPGLDFESKLFMKPDAAALLEKELRAPKYKPRVMAIGTNTDPYQPIEREQRIMRQVLEVLAAFNHPVGITTKSALVTRDIDILAPMAAKGLAKVYLSVTTLDRELARAMEPRASTPPKRLAAIKELTQAGIPVGAMMAPVIPGLNDHEMEAVLEAVKDAGAGEAAYLLLRLPLEIKDLFREWLSETYPNKAEKVISLIRQARGGVDYVAGFGTRMVGSGPIAALLAQRFENACKRLGLNERRYSLDASKFCPPPPVRGQLSLF